MRGSPAGSTRGWSTFGVHLPSLVVIGAQPVTDVTRWLRGSGLEIVLILTGTILLTRFVRWLSDRITERIDERSTDEDALVASEAAKHRHAVTQVLTWTALVVIYCVAAVLLVRRLGIPVGGLVAPAVVVGAALGFGGQRIVADVLAGIFIIAERQYGFGDVVRLMVNGAGGQTVTGTIEDVTLRVTRLRTGNGEVVITPNGLIIQAINLSRDWARTVIDVPVSASADMNAVTAALQRVLDEAHDDERLSPLLLDRPSVMGVESLAVDEVSVRVIARTLPGKQFEVGRALRARIAATLQSEGIVSTPTLNAEAPSGRS
jgi:small-conductance mechanosensitive channel